jgi:hypothetical protein
MTSSGANSATDSPVTPAPGLGRLRVVARPRRHRCRGRGLPAAAASRPPVTRRPPLTLAAVGLALGPLAALGWRFRPIPPQDLLPAGDWPAPNLASERAPDGPVLVSVEYWVVARDQIIQRM